ncbi:MAG: GGDEF domain-containing protein [Treponema sp.]|nr:GGDEF domain-containing protein [Treponema sp.]
MTRNLKKSPQEIKPLKWYNSLSVKFAALFLAFTLTIIVISGFSIFLVQRKNFEDQSIVTMKHMGMMLRDQMAADGETFLEYQKFILQNSKKVYIPFDFGDEYVEQKKMEFETAFDAAYPGKIFRNDVKFSDLSYKMKILFCNYYHSKWFLYFEKMREWYDAPYVYYVLPSDNKVNVIYIFDTERTYEGDERYNRLHLCDNFAEDYDEMPFLFDTWQAGEMLDGMDSFDNEYGRTYSYYVPLWIGQEKAGLVCVDMDIDYVHSNIARSVAQLVGASALIMFIGIFFLMVFINRKYVAKLSRLSRIISTYGEYKDAVIAQSIANKKSGRDEIGVMESHVAKMMTELDTYMKKLTMKEKELVESIEESTHDALTGIRNKKAYDMEVKKISHAIAKGKVKFGIAMIDMNFLKNINDNFGHECGNFAIKKLCRLICLTFDHSPVFRVGGDEFVVLLQNEDYDNIRKVERNFNDAMERQNAETGLKEWERVSAALGYAFFDSKIDSSIQDTFARADKAMYERKKAMKAERK